ncbi:hypothetical protein AB0E01_44195, partial [Nocardia vinacea]|uniref:hypothetical protein n=1 Tax=Nocardia vinacea TaxID=96468 RepID=UPI0033EE1E8D
LCYPQVAAQRPKPNPNPITPGRRPGERSRLAVVMVRVIINYDFMIMSRFQLDRNKYHSQELIEGWMTRQSRTRHHSQQWEVPVRHEFEVAAGTL